MMEYHYKSTKMAIMKILRTTIQNAGKVVVPLQCSHITCGNAKNPSTLDESLTVSYEDKHILTAWSTNLMPECLEKRNENTYSPKALFIIATN